MNGYKQAVIKYAKEFAESMEDVICEGLEDFNGPSLLEFGAIELLKAMENGNCTQGFGQFMAKHLATTETMCSNPDEVTQVKIR